MQFEKIQNKGQATLFKNQYLEFFTKTHPLVAWGMYMPVVLLLIFYSVYLRFVDLPTITLLFGGGVFFWTFFEYLIHRFAFHLESNRNWTKRLIYLIHGNHHEYPRDKQRLFMPPLPSLLLSSALFLLFNLLFSWLNAPNLLYAFFSGFLFGYLLYGSIHYAIHAINPPFKWMKPLWRNHHLHHYKEEGRGFGVSSTLWDRVFGTSYDLSKEKENPEEIKKLLFKEDGA